MVAYEVADHLARPTDPPTLAGDVSRHKGSDDLAGTARPIASTLVLSQHSQFIAAGVCDAQGEIATQPGPHDLEGTLYTTSCMATGPGAQQQPCQRSDESYEHDVQARRKWNER